MGEKKKLLDRARMLEPCIRIGKMGVTETVIEEIKRQLKLLKLIKIKFLAASMEGKDRKELAKEIADKTQSTLIQQVGFVAVYYKPSAE